MMYCQLRPPASANLKNTSDPMLMVAFTFTMRRHLIQLASAPFTSFRLAKFCWALFADFRVRQMATKHAEHRTHEVWIKTLVPF